MTYCEKYRRGAVLPCNTRPQCVAECRAGWLEVPVGCQDCGRPTFGPFIVTVYDDGSDMVFYALVCAECAYHPDPHAGPTPEDRRGVMMMTEVPLRREPNL